MRAACRAEGNRSPAVVAIDEFCSRLTHGSFIARSTRARKPFKQIPAPGAGHPGLCPFENCAAVGRPGRWRATGSSAKYSFQAASKSARACSKVSACRRHGGRGSTGEQQRAMPPFGASQVIHGAVELLEADSYHCEANEGGNTP